MTRPKLAEHEVVRFVAMSPAPAGLHAICVLRGDDGPHVEARRVHAFETAIVDRYARRAGCDSENYSYSAQHDELLADGWKCVGQEVRCGFLYADPECGLVSTATDPEPEVEAVSFEIAETAEVLAASRKWTEILQNCGNSSPA